MDEQTMKRTKSARGAPRGARAAAKRSEDSEEVEGGALKRIVAAGTVAFSVLTGVEGAIEPARAAGSATEIVQLALDAVEDPDAKAEAPERVKADTSSLEGALKAQVQSRKSTVKEAGKKAAKAAAAPAKSGAPEGAMSPNAKDYKSEIGESLATLDYDAIIKKTDDYFVYRYDRGIDESQIIDLDDEDDSATRGPKGTKKRVAVAKSTTAPSFTLPSFTAPSFDAPSFSIPTFEVPSIEIPAIPGATEPATKKDTSAEDAAKADAAAAKKAEAEAAAARKAEADAATAKKAEADAAAAKKADAEAAKKADAEAAKKAKADAEAAKKAAAEAAKAEAAAKKAESAKKPMAAAPAAGSSDLGFDFGSLSQYMESAPAAPKVDKKAEAAAKKAAEKAAAEAAKKAAEEEKKAAAAAKAAAKAAPKPMAAAPAAGSSDLGFDFGSLSQYMESAPATPKAPKADNASAAAGQKAAEKIAKQQKEAAKKAEAAAKKAEAAAKKAQAQEEAAAARAAAKAEMAAKKAAGKSAEKPTYSKRTVEKKAKPTFTKSARDGKFAPFAGTYKTTVVEKEALPGVPVDFDAIVDAQEAKAEAILAKANDKSGDFLNISGEAGFAIAGTIALVYETEDKKFREQAKNAKMPAPTKTNAPSGESTTEGWFDGVLKKYMNKDGSAPKPKPVAAAPKPVAAAPKPAVPKSDPVKNAKEAQSWMDKWSASKPKPAAAAAPAPAPAAPKPAAPKSDPVKNAKEAQSWMDNWERKVKPTAAAAPTPVAAPPPTPVAAPAPTPVAAAPKPVPTPTVSTTTTRKVTSDNLTAEQRAAAEAWLKKWREDGRPTDETKFDEAKTWLKQHNFD